MIQYIAVNIADGTDAAVLDEIIDAVAEVDGVVEAQASGSTIVITGDPFGEGFKVFGPFVNTEDADEFGDGQMEATFTVELRDPVPS